MTFPVREWSTSFFGRKPSRDRGPFFSLELNEMWRSETGFDPQRDAKRPVRRDPLSLVVRGARAFFSLLLSDHPADAGVWARSLWLRRQPLRVVRPWITFAAARAISESMPAGGRVFEYGAGHSTLYWAMQGYDVVSVESDALWYRLVAERSAETGLANISLTLDSDREGYVRRISAFPEGHFDLVLVDGIHRRECVHAAVPHVRPGGLLVVDNTDWHWFRESPLKGIPGNWKRSVHAGYAPMLGHLSETTIWRRPLTGRVVLP